MWVHDDKTEKRNDDQINVDQVRHRSLKHVQNPWAVIDTAESIKMGGLCHTLR